MSLTGLTGCTAPFSTAGKNRAVRVSDETLRAIKRKFAESNDVLNQEDSISSNSHEEENGSNGVVDMTSLFRTAGTNSVISVSDDAIKKARKTLEYEDKIDCNTPKRAPLAVTSQSSANTSPQRPITPVILPAMGGRFNSPFRPPITRNARCSTEASSIQTPCEASPSNGIASSPVTRKYKNPCMSSPSFMSPLARLCLQSPSTSNHSTCTRICDISCTMNKFRIKVKVTERSSRPVKYGVNGELRFFATLMDEDGGKLEVEAMGEMSKKAEEDLDFGKWYTICNGRLFKRRPSKANQSGIVLQIDDNTTIEVDSSIDVPLRRHASILIPLSEISADKELDVAAVVSGVNAQANPSDGWKEYSLVDQRGRTILRLSHEYLPVEAQHGDILLVYCCILKFVEGCDEPRLCSIRGRTKILINPQSEDSRLRLLPAWNTKGEWKVSQNDVNASFRPLSSILLNPLMKTRDESEVCLAKVSNIAMGVVKENCIKCGKRKEGIDECSCGDEVETRKSLHLEVELCDATSIVRASVEGSVAEYLVDMTANEAEEMLRWNVDVWRQQCRRVLFIPRLFTIKRCQRKTSSLDISGVSTVHFDSCLHSLDLLLSLVKYN